MVWVFPPDPEVLKNFSEGQSGQPKSKTYIDAANSIGIMVKPIYSVTDEVA